uniref:BPTI/Kunitz inhibitor domain-containing protein n=1 Tax=Echinococcus granulosus TaxID=6210 RepID=A0A7E4T5P0_ECHGR
MKSGDGSGEEDVCGLLMRTGLCIAYFRVWGYNPASDQCECFIYGGCGGNANRFKEKMEYKRAVLKIYTYRNMNFSLIK